MADAERRRAKGLKPEAIRSALFFPYAETLIQHAAPQQLQVTGDGLALRLQRSALSTGPPTDAGGVLVIDEALGRQHGRGRHSTLGNVAIRHGAAARQPPRSPPSCRRPCSPSSAASSST